MSLLQYEINGSRLTVQVPTSVKKDGSFRYRNAHGVGGDPYMARGSDVHYKKLDKIAAEISAITGDEWERTELVYLMEPREYYGIITDGTTELCYQYITTLAPGSGQQYFFCPRLGNKRIQGTNFHVDLAAIMLKYDTGLIYEKVPWQDVKLIVDIFRSGVSADMLATTLQLMR